MNFPDELRSADRFIARNNHQHPTTDSARWLWTRIKRRRWLLAGSVVGSVGFVFLNSAIPGLVGAATDAVIENKKAVFERCVIVLFTLVFLRGVVDLVARYCTETLAKRVERELRDEVYLSLLSKSQQFHDRHRVGDLMARAVDDVREVGTTIAPNLDRLVDSLLQALAPLFFIALIDWRLLAEPMTFELIFIVFLRPYLKRSTPLSIKARDQNGALSALAHQTIRGVDIVQATGSEEREYAHFVAAATRYRDIAVEQARVQARYFPSLALTLATAVGLVHALLYYKAGSISLGDVIAYIGLLGTLAWPTFASTYIFTQVQNGFASIQRILDIIEAAPASEGSNTHSGRQAKINGSIRFEDVCFSYGDGLAIKNISFSIAPGQTVAIVGQSGSGKSTITKIINGTYQPTTGSVSIDDVDVRDWDVESLRSQVSVVEQDTMLFSRSVRENIAFGMTDDSDRDEQVLHAARIAEADDFISALPRGYDTVIGERGVNLSGGQRQRLAIARALATTPRILIFDDTTSAVDSVTEDRILTSVAQASRGRTAIVVTHRLSQLRLADKILLVHRGELIDQGHHTALLARSQLYSKMFSSQADEDFPNHGEAGE